MAFVEHETDAPPVSRELASRLQGRQRVLDLQQRRFWRELAFSGAMLSADALTIATVFVLLAQLPIHFGSEHAEFVAGLLPPTPSALLRRITLMIFCLVATRAYSTADSTEQSGRIALATILGVVLPRWVELFSFLFMQRLLLITAVVLMLWLALVTQRRAMLHAIRAFDPRQLDQERTLLVGIGQQLHTFLTEHVDTTAGKPGVYEISPEWPGDDHEGWQTLYEEVHRSHADAIILVGPLSDAALQHALIAGSSAGCRVFGLRRRPLREMNNPTLMRRGEGPIALLSSPALIGWQLVAKRLLDVTGAAVGVVVLSPLLAVCALVVKLTSPGPVIFRQLRVGLGGQTFEMLKLRTMVRDADAQAATLRTSQRLSGSSTLQARRRPANHAGRTISSSQQPG